MFLEFGKEHLKVSFTFGQRPKLIKDRSVEGYNISDVGNCI